MLKLRSLEMVRAVAALLVVLFHTQHIFAAHAGVIPFRGIFGAGSRGVDLFFVLSGFIIAHVHAADVGRPSRLGNYAFNRIARIYPAVWIMTLFAGALYEAGFGGAEKAQKLTEWGVAASALLLPQTGTALVNVTWTLKYEIFFYLVFATLILNRRAGLALLAAWQLAILCIPPEALGLGGFYLRPLCLEFSLGMACALLITRPAFRAAPAQWSLLALGIAGFTAGMAMEKHPDPAGIFCALGAAAIIVALILLEQSGRLKIPETLVVLGGASYSIYLVHFSAITLFAVLIAHVPAIPLTNGVFALAAAFGVAAGVLFDRLVDRPLQRLLRNRLKPAVHQKL